MESSNTSDRGKFAQKRNYAVVASALKSSLRNRNASDSSRTIANGEIQNYKKSAKYTIGGNLTDIDNGHLVLLKDRYLLTQNNNSSVNSAGGSSVSGGGNTSNSGSNSTEYICLDIETDEKYLCKVITEPYEKVLRAYYHCTTSFSTYSHVDPCLTRKESKIRPVKDIIPIAQDRTYLLLEPQHYGNLHTYIRDRRRLTEPEARTLFRQICETVQLCHRNGVVLRDLKLRKFYFSDRDRTTLQYESLEGSVILETTTDDRLSEKIGCPLYVAPELITTTSNYNGKPADMWALGVILYTMLIGKYPFNDLDGQNLFTKILSCNIHIPLGLSSQAKCLLRSLLRRQPTERLTVEEIFYHPWFQQDANSSYDVDMRYFETSDDQCVPELLAENGGFELT